MERDIFICHASEDKQTIVIPLWKALEEKGITSWVDEGEIRWGDSITGKVDEGLRVSRFVIVVLSEVFLEKKWAQREMNAVLNIEAASGEVKVLPLLVGDKKTRDRILSYFPLLNDKHYEIWDGIPDPIVKSALVRLSRSEGAETSPINHRRDTEAFDKIPLPNLRLKFSPRNKDLFIKNAFATFRDYFRRALKELETQYTDVETDFTEVHNLKFIAKIYLNGDLKKECKVWIGGLASADGIAYSDNRITSIDSDNSFNEIINVEDDGKDLYLRFSMGSSYGRESQGLFTTAKAAEVLWKRFSSSLSQ